MIDSNSQFFAILTAVGEAKQANATALGVPWTFKEMAVGDANGTDPIPNRNQTKLINEWRRAPVNQVRTDPANPNIIITEQVIPSDVGGSWIREIGLFDADGDLVAVANCAPSFKPLLAQGTGKTQVIRMNFIVANTAQIVLKIDPAVVLATRQYVDDSLVEALPPDKNAGSFHQVTIDKRGIVVGGSNPTTLAGHGIKDAFTKPETTSAIQQAIASLVASSPAALDTLQELAAALGNDPNFATTMNNLIALKAPLANAALIGSPTAPTPAVGANNKQIATTEYVDRSNVALDPWALQPIGVPIPVMFGAAAPPTNKAYRYILLTYGDPYNAGALTGEVVTGVAPMVISYARISVAGSPIAGNTVYLINTERRSIRPGLAGSIQDDALQNIAGKLATGLPTFGSLSAEGVFGFSPPPGSSQTGVTGGGANGLTDLTFDASRSARTSNETRTKNIGANFFMRVL